MTTDNMKLWNAVKQPPKSSLKQIQAGRLKGMTDINPQWRLQAMTEQFGQCGIGWYYEIVRMWSESGAQGELMAFVHIHLFTKELIAVDAARWSAPIVGIGGSALVAKESAGLRANDEAYKMALTDALSVAMKQLGVAADIYAGRYDGSKYRDEEQSTKTGTTRPANPGNGDGLPEASKSKVMQAVGKVQALMEQGQEFEAYEAKQAAEMDTDETLFFWTHFDSKQRSALKSIHDSLQKTYGADNLDG